MSSERKITIGHLYPDLLNLYGDRGNIQCMMKRCQWRGIGAKTIEFKLEDEIDFSQLDIVLLGGGSTGSRCWSVIVFRRFSRSSKNMWRIGVWCWLCAEGISFWAVTIKQTRERYMDWIWWIFTQSRRLAG